MAESLGDRQFESFRRVQPGRVVKNRTGEASHHEEYAIAVVGVDGESLPLTTEQLLGQLVLEQRLTNLLLTKIADMEGVTIADVA